MKEGDIWCLCAQRWAHGFNAGRDPKVFSQFTHEKTVYDHNLDPLIEEDYLNTNINSIFLMTLHDIVVFTSFPLFDSTLVYF